MHTEGFAFGCYTVDGMCKVKITTQKIDSGTRFLRGNLMREKSRGEGEFHYNLWYSNYRVSL